ncbi:MAG: hypothetical protein COA82_00280 [Alkaliphilus sp.]|nr:MAG: hypothetical protein COA82_00280 [Alkaliphilus sp.]
MNKSEIFLEKMIKQIRCYKKNRSNSRRFNAYYLSNKEDLRNNIARKIDYVVIRVFILLSIFVVVFLSLKNIVNSFFVASIFLSIFQIITIRKRNKMLSYQKKYKRRLVASQKVYKDIINKPMEELKKYIVEILQKSDLRDIEELMSNSSNFTYNATYKNEIISVSFFIYKVDYLIELKELKEFLFNSKNNKVNKGIVITTSDFTKDCYELTNEISKNYKLLLINKEKLIMLIESGDMFPTEEEIDESIEEIIHKKFKTPEKYKTVLFNETKIKKYLSLSFFLFILSFFTPYIIYYMSAAGFTFGLACVTSILKVKNIRENTKKCSDEDERLLDLDT